MFYEQSFTVLLVSPLDWRKSNMCEDFHIGHYHPPFGCLGFFRGPSISCPTDKQLESYTNAPTKGF